MFYKLKDRLRRARFGSRVRNILDTPPVAMTDGAAPVVLSQLQHKDLLMYLAAIKSFARQVPPKAVHIVDDGSLTADDRELLSRHVPGLQFHPLTHCCEPGLPTGGTWERLVAIARLSQSHYVIQLDADTLAVGPLAEVAAAVAERRAFTIGTWDGQEIEAAGETARRARARMTQPLPHVQVATEALLDQLHSAEALKYVRGCSGFAGFPPGPGKIEMMHSLSSQIQQLIGTRWREWGSEQVMSNLLVANQSDARVLPHPDYTDCEKMHPGKTRFVHFIGTCRFRGGRYADMIQRLDW